MNLRHCMIFVSVIGIGVVLGQQYSSGGNQYGGTEQGSGMNYGYGSNTGGQQYGGNAYQEPGMNRGYGQSQGGGQYGGHVNEHDTAANRQKLLEHAHGGRYAEAMALINMGVSPHAKDGAGYSTLYFAITGRDAGSAEGQSRYTLVKELLSRGVQL